MMKWLLFAFVAATPAVAEASDASAGYVSFPIGTFDGAVLFNTSGSFSSPRPGCNVVPNRYAIDANTLAGQSALSVVMTAYVQHKRVVIGGRGLCSPLWNDTEAADIIILQD